MPGFSNDGKVGAARLGVIDVSAQFRAGETTLIDENYVAIYVYVGQTLTGSAAVALNAAWTASASAGGYIVLAASASAEASAGTYVWVRSSANIA